MARGEEGIATYTYQGQEKIITYAPVKSAGWSLAVTVPKAESVTRRCWGWPKTWRNRWSGSRYKPAYVGTGFLHTGLEETDEKGMPSLSPGKLILQIEKYRRKLAAVAPGDPGKLLEISRKMDRLILEYYRLNFTSGMKPGDFLRRD